MRRARAAFLLAAALLLASPVASGAAGDPLMEAARLAADLYKEGRYAEAEPLFRTFVAVAEKLRGPDHPDVADRLIALADVDQKIGRPGDAEPALRRALAILEKARGPDHPSVASALDGLGLALDGLGRYAEAEPAYQRALAIREAGRPQSPADLAVSLNNLGDFYRGLGRYAEAEPLLRRAVAAAETASDTGTLAKALNNLAALLADRGRVAEAEHLYQRSLALREQASGANHPDVAVALNNLAELYKEADRFADAEALVRRSLSMLKASLGPAHPLTVRSLNNLAALLSDEGRGDEAEALYKRALDEQDRAPGADPRWLATYLNNLGELYRQQDRRAEAKAALERALSLEEKALGTEHPDTAATLGNLGKLALAGGDIATAERLHRRALKAREAAFGPDHPDVAASMVQLALVRQAAGDAGAALDWARRASAIYSAPAARGEGSSIARAEANSAARVAYRLHVALAAGVAQAHPGDRAALVTEAFEAAQRARDGEVGLTLARTAARFAAGTDRLAATVREKQDAGDQWRALQKRLLAARTAAVPNTAAVTALRESIGELERRIAGLDARLASEFPDYAELADPQPLAINETRALLRRDEALLVYTVADDATFLWIVRPGAAPVLHKLPVGRAALTLKVGRLRRALDLERNPELAPFPVDAARALYQDIFAVAEPALPGVRHLLVVADAALQRIPLGVLVTGPAPPVTGPTGYREVPWLARRYAVSILPSVSSLRALRRFAGAARAEKPFIGFGDPALTGPKDGRRGVRAEDIFRDGKVDVEAVRHLTPLPDTAQELKALAVARGADPAASVFLRERASKHTLGELPLERYAVLAFATHGFVAGSFRLAEPGLVLSPPARPSADDDGLLTASDVARLKLNADWVVLSACNTAADDGSVGAEGLSGLAKAFFHAGARAVLVSHWPVFSEASVRLTTRAFAELARHPEIGRAEAMRRSEMALLDDPPREEFSHPAAWAPFTLVGEGE